MGSSSEAPAGADARVSEPETFANEWERHWLPRAPLAGRAKASGYYRTTRERALTLPYIEANPAVLRSLVVTDHDGGDADLQAELAGLPAPSYVALNPATRAGHIVYALHTPVVLTDAARRAPVNLLARIEHGLVSSLGGDVAYGGRITKNPQHVQDHLALWGPSTAVYGLRDLAAALDRIGALPGAGKPREHVTTSAVGRNVALFDDVRRWSYRRRGDYTSPSEWDRDVFAWAWQHNETVIAENFTRGPLSAGEVQHLARSVSRWTWRKILRTFAEEQAERGRRGGLRTAARGGVRNLAQHAVPSVDRGAVVGAAAPVRKVVARIVSGEERGDVRVEYVAPGLSVELGRAVVPVQRSRTAREAAERVGVSERTVRRVIAEPRAAFEGRTAERRARVVELRAAGLSQQDVAGQLGVSVRTVQGDERAARLARAVDNRLGPRTI